MLDDAFLAVLEATLLADWFRVFGAFPPPSATFAASTATVAFAFAALATAGRHNLDRAQKPVTARSGGQHRIVFPCPMHYPPVAD